jgi:hypothetical protein
MAQQIEGKQDQASGIEALAPYLQKEGLSPKDIPASLHGALVDRTAAIKEELTLIGDLAVQLALRQFTDNANVGDALSKWRNRSGANG